MSGLRQRIEKLEVTKCWTDDKDPCPYKYYSKDCATKTERIIDQINKTPVLTELDKTYGKIQARRDELENKASEMMMKEPSMTISKERVVIEALIDELDDVLKDLDSEEAQK